MNHDPCNLCGSEYHSEGEHRRISRLAELLKQARYWLAAEVVPARAVREPLIVRIDAALNEWNATDRSPSDSSKFGTSGCAGGSEES